MSQIDSDDHQPGSSQGTLNGPVSFKGRGLHTGKRSMITVYPAAENSGIVFRRTDRAGRNHRGEKTEIRAHWKHTKQLPLCTCIASGEDIHVRTIEHLMAAFYACGVDNALIEVKGAELPILDGSARPYVKKINHAGVSQQSAQRIIYRINRALEVREDNRFIRIEPAETLNINISIALRFIGRLAWQGDVTPELFSRDFSPARTFGRLKNGLLAQLTRFSRDPVCLGANTSSAVVVVKGDKVLNRGGLRMQDEYVRHRMLDLIGDLMLSGGHIQGKITAHSPAHRMTHALLEKIFEEEAYTRIG